MTTSSRQSNALAKIVAIRALQSDQATSELMQARAALILQKKQIETISTLMQNGAREWQDYLCKEDPDPSRLIYLANRLALADSALITARRKYVVNLHASEKCTEAAQSARANLKASKAIKRHHDQRARRKNLSIEAEKACQMHMWRQRSR